MQHAQKTMQFIKNKTD